jgi:hypothetical protein
MPGISVSKMCIPFGAGGIDYLSYWATRGVTPGADATLITTEINTALTNFGTVKITEAGVYDIDDTIYIPSNRTLEFVAGCTIKKTGDETTYTHVFINKGVLTNTRDVNINVYGNGLRVMVNGIDDYTSTLAESLRTRGQIQFLNVDNLMIDDLYIDDGGTNQYGLCVAGCTFTTINDYKYKGEKDGLKIIACSDCVVNSIETDSLDDGISIVGADYNIVSCLIGSSERVTIDGWIDKPHAAAYGRSILFLQDSWDDWGNGVTYGYQEACNNAGNLYRKSNAGSAVASVAPTHTTGEVTGADGIKWLYIQNSVTKIATVKDVIVQNVVTTASRTFVNFDGDNTILNKVGTAKFDNITFNNITFTPTVRNMCFCRYSGIVGTVYVNDSIINPTVDPLEAYEDYVLLGDVAGKTASFDEIIFDNCQVDMNTGPGIFANFDDDPLVSFDKLTILNSDIAHSRVSSELFYTNNADQLKEVVLTDTTITDLYGLVHPMYPATNANVNIVATRCSFVDPKNVQRIQNYADITITISAIDCVFYETSWNYLFYNENAGSVLSIDLLRASGSITPTKLSSSNITVLRNNWVTVATPSLGAEIIGNTDFTLDEWWGTKGVGTSISDGVANIVGLEDIAGGGAYWSLRKDTILTVGKTYRLVFDARQLTGEGYFQIGESYTPMFDRQISANWDTYEIVHTVATYAHLAIGGRGNGDTFELDNISLKEVL